MGLWDYGTMGLWDYGTMGRQRTLALRAAPSARQKTSSFFLVFATYCLDYSLY